MSWYSTFLFVVSGIMIFFISAEGSSCNEEESSQHHQEGVEDLSHGDDSDETENAKGNDDSLTEVPHPVDDEMGGKQEDVVRVV